MRTFAFVLVMGLATPALAGGHGGFGAGGGCYGGRAFAAPIMPTYGVRAFAAPVMPAYGVSTFAAAAPVVGCNLPFGAPAGGCAGGGGGGFSAFSGGIGYGATPVLTTPLVATPVVPVLPARRPGLRQRIRAARRGFRTGF